MSQPLTPDERADHVFGHMYLVMQPGGTCTYRAAKLRYLGDGVGDWIGWLGDATDDQGRVRWWFIWREDGDPADRYFSGPVFEKFTEARDAFIQHRKAHAD